MESDSFLPDFDGGEVRDMTLLPEFDNGEVRVMMDLAAQEREEVKRAMHRAHNITIGPTILPHDFTTKKPFHYWDVGRTRRQVLGKRKDGPIHIQEHIIVSKRFKAARLKRDRDLPPESPTRRSSRIAAKQGGNQAVQAPSQAPAASTAPASSMAPAPSSATTASSTPASSAPAPAPPPQREWDETALDIAAVLSYRVDEDLCEMCQSYCKGDACYAKFLREHARVFAHSIEVKDTGSAMGLGLYVKRTVQRPIEEGRMLDEYLGDLYPPISDEIDDTSYVFEIKDVVQIDARLQGNYTRFVNHHCEPNVIADRVRLGQRRAVVFRAKRDLIPGEQIFVHYSRNYFEEGERLCHCEAQAEPHIPSFEKSKKEPNKKSGKKSGKQSGKKQGKKQGKK
ncbi:bacteriophage N adsorption protein A c-term domain-containing protein [Apiospora arundinis]